MIQASGYVLRVRPERAETLLNHAAPGQSVGEPVPRFALSARAPLLILVSFSPDAITHIADGRKGVASGTQMVRLNLVDLQELAAPVPIARLTEALSPRARAPVERRLAQGGLLAPASFQAVIDALRQLAPDIADRMTRFSNQRARALAQLSDRTRDALAQQKESVGLALKIAGFDTRILQAWAPPTDAQPSSFLDGLPGARVREDAMVAHDLGILPGFDAVRDYPFAAKLFERDGTRLTVILANKLPLEQQFGTDLIYFNDTYQAFVMVQYKAMERVGTAKAEFRLPNAQLDLEIGRMDATAQTLAAIPDDESRDGFRLHTGPFFLKLCARHIFNPDDGGLFPGMYIPLDYWRRLVVDPATVGPKGGRVVTFENVGRKLTESEFIPLVAGGWVGTHTPQSQILTQVVRDIIESGKAVTLAVRSGRDASSRRRR
ncbi:hypothetical protein [Sphingomonas sp.]|uniref:hypothetical protein n=1 Tax=Sphingomonas sp. TaxID=28214 RepID=UPI003D6D9DE2